MAASYRSINYSLRPAKHAERRMFAEAFRRLSHFAAVESYQYVGMGSLWFSDFAYFHRSLGLNNMISIERAAHDKARFEFNTPFNSISLRFGQTGIELPKIDWSLRTISWLDYDNALSMAMLADSRTVISKSCSGSVFIISVQCEFPPTIQDADDDDPETQKSVGNIEELRSAYGPKRIPEDATDGDLRGWKLAKLIRKIVLSEISDALDAVNISRHPAQKLEFKQIMAFEYADGAKMTTIGGILVDRGQANLFSACGFSDLDFYRDGLDAQRLDVPLLTHKEMRELETRLPPSTPGRSPPRFIPQSDVKAFEKLYRYLPSFASFEP